MTPLVIFVLLLTGRLVRGATEDIVRSGDEARLAVKPDGVPSRCALETNRGEVLEYEPGSHKIREDIRADDPPCSVRIDKANSTHAGLWKVTATVPKVMQRSDIRDDDTTSEVFEFNLYIQEEVTIFADHIEVYDGHYVNIKHSKNYGNLTACNLTGPAGESTDLLTEKRDDLQLFGQCGVRMRANANSDGHWKLDAMNADNVFVLHRASFYVDVVKQEEPDPKSTLALRWIRGTAGVISLSVRPKICQIVDPNKVIVATSRGECFHKVKIATVRHEGVWLARYNMYGMVEPIEQQLRVETVDRATFNVKVDNYTENGSTRLLCRIELQSANYLDSCSFTRPDGTILYMTPLIGNERYSGYISPIYGAMNRTLVCGVIIREPEDIDYGAWRCDLGVGNPSEVYGSVFHVDRPDSRIYGNTDAKGRAVEARTDDVHVKRGDPFTIKCTVGYALEYCWLRSPNGTAYSVTRDKDVVSPFVLQYEGDGLAFGECGAQISAAVTSDHGLWGCFMGVADGAEEAATVPVMVTETYLMAEQTEIAVGPRNDLVLSCRILPRMLDSTVHYCRWIRPDGYGIYNDISHRYTANSSYSQCRLVILNYRPEEDEGRWTCVAGLAGRIGHLEEAQAHVAVTSYNTDYTYTGYYGGYIGVVAGTAVLLVSVLGIVGYVAIRKRRRFSPPMEPPAYDSPQSYYTPKSLQPEFDTKPRRL